MVRCATQKGMKKVRCSRFSVVPFSNLKVEHRTDFRESPLRAAVSGTAGPDKGVCREAESEGRRRGKVRTRRIRLRRKPARRPARRGNPPYGGQWTGPPNPDPDTRDSASEPKPSPMFSAALGCGRRGLEGWRYRAKAGGAWSVAPSSRRNHDQPVAPDSGTRPPDHQVRRVATVEETAGYGDYVRCCGKSGAVRLPPARFESSKLGARNPQLLLCQHRLYLPFVQLQAQAWAGRNGQATVLEFEWVFEKRVERASEAAVGEFLSCVAWDEYRGEL